MGFKDSDAEITELRGDAELPPLLGWEGAGEFLGVTPRMVRELWARRELAGIRVGKHIRFTRADLAKYVEHHRVESVR